MNPIDLCAAPASDPTLVFGYRDCLYAPDMLTVALVELDLFTWIGRRPVTAPEIEQHFGLHPRPVDVMLALFVATGLLVRDGDAVRVTPSAVEFLDRGSPWYIGPYYASLKDRPVVKDLVTVLRTGRPANWASQQQGADWHRLMETDDFAKSFTAAMDCRGVYLAGALARQLDLSDTKRLLDIAGGSGVYACSLVAHHPHLTAAVLEKQPVDRIAARSIEQRGHASRVEVFAGDMMKDPLPQGFDAHLWSNVLHDWDVPEVRQLIRASAEALPSGGLFIMHDAFLNRAKTGPRHVAEYSVLLMHSTQGRCYGVAEMEIWLEEAGFGAFTFAETAAARGCLTAIKR